MRIITLNKIKGTPHYELSPIIRIGLPSLPTYGGVTPIIIPLPTALITSEVNYGILTIRHRLQNPLKLELNQIPQLNNLRIIGPGDYPPTPIVPETPNSTQRTLSAEWNTLIENIGIGNGLMLALDINQAEPTPTDIEFHIELRDLRPEQPAEPAPLPRSAKRE